MSGSNIRFSLVVLLLGSVLACANVNDLPEGYVISQHNKEAVLRYLRAALMAHGEAGRVYYSTACEAQDGTPLPFPQVEVQSPSNGKTGLTAVRDIFRKDKRVNVSEDATGIIRVTIGEPASALLQTRIHSLTLKQHEQYNPELAIFAILNSTDVEVAIRQLGFDQPDTTFGGSINVPGKGMALPHLPASMMDVTMDQALDLVAKTFRGIVIYETCADASGKRLVSLDFAHVADF